MFVVRLTTATSNANHDDGPEWDSGQSTSLLWRGRQLLCAPGQVAPLGAETGPQARKCRVPHPHLTAIARTDVSQTDPVDQPPAVTQHKTGTEDKSGHAAPGSTLLSEVPRPYM